MIRRSFFGALASLFFIPNRILKWGSGAVLTLPKCYDAEGKEIPAYTPPLPVVGSRDIIKSKPKDKFLYPWTLIDTKVRNWVGVDGKTYVAETKLWKTNDNFRVESHTLHVDGWRASHGFTELMFSKINSLS